MLGLLLQFVQENQPAIFSVLSLLLGLSLGHLLTFHRDRTAFEREHRAQRRQEVATIYRDVLVKLYTAAKLKEQESRKEGKANKTDPDEFNNSLTEPLIALKLFGTEAILKKWQETLANVVPNEGQPRKQWSISAEELIRLMVEQLNTISPA